MLVIFIVIIIIPVTLKEWTQKSELTETASLVEVCTYHKFWVHYVARTLASSPGCFPETWYQLLQPDTKPHILVYYVQRNNIT